MKKLIKKMIPIALALAFCIGAVSMAACGTNKDVVFEGSKDNVMGMPVVLTLTLKADGTANFDFKFDVAEKEEGGALEKMEAAFSGTGTYEFKDNVYTVKLGEGATAKTLTSSYNEETKTYTIPYGIAGQETTINVDLTYTAE